MLALRPGSHGRARRHAVVLTAVAGLLRSGPAGVVDAFAKLGDALPESIHLGYPEQHAHSYRFVRLVAAALSQRGAQLAWEGLREAVASGSVSGLADYLTVVAAIDSAKGWTQRASVLAREARRRSTRAGDRRGVYLSLVQSFQSPADRDSFPTVCDALDGTAPQLAVDCRLQRLAELWSKGELEPAITVYERLATIPRQDSSPILIARFADVAAPLLLFLGRWHALEETLDRGAWAANRLGRHDAATRIELMRVAALRAFGRTAEARARLAAIGETESSAELETRIWLERARLASASSRSVEVVDHLRKAHLSAMRASDSARTLVILTNLEIGHADFGLWKLDSPDLVSNLPASGSPFPLAQATADAVLAEKAGRPEFAVQAYARAEVELGKWIAEVGDFATRLSALSAWEGLGRRRARLELDAGRWAAGLEALDRSRSSLRDERSIRLAHLQTHLEADEAIVTFRFLDTEAWVWLVRSSEVHAMRLAASAAEIQGAADLWVESVSTARPNSAWRQLGWQLARLTMHRVEAVGWLDGLQTLIVLPGGGLATLPLDSLPSMVPLNGFYGDRIVFARARTISDLDRSMHRRPRGHLAVAFIPSGRATALPEVEGILARSSGRAFLGADATEAAFVDQAAKSSLIHFGGHSRPPSAGKDAGGLTLRPSISHNGFLSFAEIAALDLEGATVVLLGCDTARATILGAGDWGGLPTSLADAFMAAGSRNVVGSLWPLDERTAGELGQLFYSAGGPESGAASLAAAKKALRERYPGEPFRWGGAVWQGAPQGLE